MVVYTRINKQILRLVSAIDGNPVTLEALAFLPGVPAAGGDIESVLSRLASDLVVPVIKGNVM